jgi:uncharacterized protein (TIGR03084 family)
MLEQARDYLAECATLDALLRRLPEAEWRAPTQFKGWTADDIVGHLHIFDYAADLTLDSTEALRGFFARMLEGRSERWTLLDFTRAWLDGCQGDALRQRWFEFAGRLAARYQGADPARRVAWGGPDMSARSCISSRQMETWSHGQALFDLLGVERDEGDRRREHVRLEFRQPPASGPGGAAIHRAGRAVRRALAMALAGGRGSNRGQRRRFLSRRHADPARR